LNWDVQYPGRETLFAEVYFGTTYEDVNNNNATPFAIISKNSYEIKNLYFERTYYWKVRPYTSKVVGNHSEIFSFFVTKKVPSINLNSPSNNTIVLPRDNLTLRWEIVYSQPSKITCYLYWGTSPTFSGITGIKVGNNNSHFISGMKETTYYWKVVPYLDLLLGQTSETWSFTMKKVEVPKAVVKEPNNTTLFSSGESDESILVTFSWQFEYEGTYDPADVWYEVFLDNSTDDPEKMTRVSGDNYKQTFYTTILPFEENMTYFWYVVPHLDTDEGSITGVCQSGVVYFSIGPPDRIYLLDIELLIMDLQVEAGTQKIIGIIVKNLGNQKTTVDLTSLVEGTDLVIATPDVKILTLNAGEFQEISLNVLALQNAEPGKYNVTIIAMARESTVVYDLDMLNVTVPEDANGDGIESDDSFFDMGILTSIIVIAMILLLISAFMYTTIKRHRLLENQRREAIYNYIKENPGDHFRSIMNELSLEVGTLSYHMNKLESEGYIKSRQDGMYRRFYTIDAKIDGRLILSELQERILNFIKSNPGIAGSNIANQFGMDRKIIRYHVGVLEKIGIIYTEKSGREVLCFSTSGA
jgi:DNA-binding MarR family transcriptional regulator